MRAGRTSPDFVMDQESLPVTSACAKCVLYRNRPVKQRRSQRMETILAIATRLFCDRGYHATTTKEVSTAAGFLSTSLYDYVQSKEELFYLVLMRMANLALADLERSLNRF